MNDHFSLDGEGQGDRFGEVEVLAFFGGINAGIVPSERFE